MANNTNNTNITIDDEVIDVDSLSDESKLYLEHLIDLEQQTTKLNFKLQQLRTSKSAFLSMFNKSKQKE